MAPSRRGTGRRRAAERAAQHSLLHTALDNPEERIVPPVQAALPASVAQDVAKDVATFDHHRVEPSASATVEENVPGAPHTSVPISPALLRASVPRPTPTSLSVASTSASDDASQSASATVGNPSQLPISIADTASPVSSAGNKLSAGSSTNDGDDVSPADVLARKTFSMPSLAMLRSLQLPGIPSRLRRGRSRSSHVEGTSSNDHVASRKRTSASVVPTNDGINDNIDQQVEVAPNSTFVEDEGDIGIAMKSRRLSSPHDVNPNSTHNTYLQLNPRDEQQSSEETSIAATVPDVLRVSSSPALVNDGFATGSSRFSENVVMVPPLTVTDRSTEGMVDVTVVDCQPQSSNRLVSSLDLEKTDVDDEIMSPQSNISRSSSRSSGSSFSVVSQSMCNVTGVQSRSSSPLKSIITTQFPRSGTLSVVQSASQSPVTANMNIEHVTTQIDDVPVNDNNETVMESRSVVESTKSPSEEGITGAILHFLGLDYKPPKCPTIETKNATAPSSPIMLARSLSIPGLALTPEFASIFDECYRLYDAARSEDVLTTSVSSSPDSFRRTLSVKSMSSSLESSPSHVGTSLNDFTKVSPRGLVPMGNQSVRNSRSSDKRKGSKKGKRGHHRTRRERRKQEFNLANNDAITQQEGASNTLETTDVAVTTRTSTPSSRCSESILSDSTASSTSSMAIVDFSINDPQDHEYDSADLENHVLSFGSISTEALLAAARDSLVQQHAINSRGDKPLQAQEQASNDLTQNLRQHVWKSITTAGNTAQRVLQIAKEMLIAIRMLLKAQITELCRLSMSAAIRTNSAILNVNRVLVRLSLHLLQTVCSRGSLLLSALVLVVQQQLNFLSNIEDSLAPHFRSAKATLSAMFTSVGKQLRTSAGTALALIKQSYNDDSPRSVFSTVYILQLVFSHAATYALFIHGVNPGQNEYFKELSRIAYKFSAEPLVQQASAECRNYLLRNGKLATVVDQTASNSRMVRHKISPEVILQRPFGKSVSSSSRGPITKQWNRGSLIPMNKDPFYAKDSLSGMNSSQNSPSPRIYFAEFPVFFDGGSSLDFDTSQSSLKIRRSMLAAKILLNHMLQLVRPIRLFHELPSDSLIGNSVARLASSSGPSLTRFPIRKQTDAEIRLLLANMHMRLPWPICSLVSQDPTSMGLIERPQLALTDHTGHVGLHSLLSNLVDMQSTTPLNELSSNGWKLRSALSGIFHWAHQVLIASLPLFYPPSSSSSLAFDVNDSMQFTDPYLPTLAKHACNAGLSSSVASKQFDMSLLAPQFIVF